MNMESIYFIIALLTAGAALVSGLIGLFIGLDKAEGQKTYLVFGLMAMCVFMFIILPPTGFILVDKPPYPIEVEIKRIFSWTYYIFLAWFIEYYSGYKKRKVVIAISAITVISYFTMIFTTGGNQNPVWRMLIILPLTMILVYGFMASGYMLKSTFRNEGRWLLAAMFLFGFLYTISLINTFDSGFTEKLFGVKIFFPLNLNHLGFIIIMSLRLQKNTLNRFRLEKVLRLRNSQWDALFQTIQLLIIEVDKEGKIVYVNPFTISHLGYQNKEEILGLNWFESFIPSDEKSHLKSAFSTVIEKRIASHNEKYTIKTRVGEERLINWTCVMMEEDNGKTKGALCIGMDTTDLETAFRQVQEMKNELEKENLYHLCHPESQAGFINKRYRITGR
jgi:PAS domain S-box-containing protein